MTPEHPAPSEWRERVAAVLGEHRFVYQTRDRCTCGIDIVNSQSHRAHVASSLLPLLAEAQAEAWDEGYLRGALDECQDSEPADNPYRIGGER